MKTIILSLVLILTISVSAQEKTNKEKIDRVVRCLTGEPFESLNNALTGSLLKKTTDRDKLPAAEKSIAVAMNSNNFSEVEAIESFIDQYLHQYDLH